MAKNIVICCDGTNNEFGSQNTNVVRLLQCLDRDPTKQMIYYDPGVGTLPEPGWLPWIGEKLSRWWSLAFGAGLETNVVEAYSYLMDVWQTGDRVFLFGYSRGAYTVRLLAAVLHAMGLLAKDNDVLVPYAMKYFKAIRKSGSEEAKSKYWQLCEEFRRTFGRDTSAADNRFPVHFLGAWDTVSSVGWIWDPATFPFTASNPSVQVVRHAVAIDERRAFFRQNLFGHVPGQDKKKHWFGGAHGDIGGGYPQEEGGLWHCAFQWMLNEAESAQLCIDSHRTSKVLADAPKNSWAEPKHESLTPAWWIAEFAPKMPGAGKYPFRLNLFRRRYVTKGSLIDRTALMRIRTSGYEPPNFSQSFLEKIRNLPHVPDALPFEW